MKEKRYLGDGVYASFDAGMIELTTSDGFRPTNAIYLEPEVYLALRDFAKECWEKS